jgi:hypothetical protein
MAGYLACEGAVWCIRHDRPGSGMVIWEHRLVGQTRERSRIRLVFAPGTINVGS